MTVAPEAPETRFLEENGFLMFHKKRARKPFTPCAVRYGGLRENGFLVFRKKQAQKPVFLKKTGFSGYTRHSY